MLVVLIKSLSYEGLPFRKLNLRLKKCSLFSFFNIYLKEKMRLHVFIEADQKKVAQSDVAWPRAECECIATDPEG